MKKVSKFIPIIAVVSIISTAALANILDMDSNDKDIENAKAAQIMMVDAITKVTKAHDGIVISAILEDKKGGKLVYEIDLVQGEKEVEVWVDAKTGTLSELMDD